MIKFRNDSKGKKIYSILKEEISKFLKETEIKGLDILLKVYK